MGSAFRLSYPTVRLLASILVGLVLAGPTRAAAGEAEALVRRIEARHGTPGDMTARFTQTYRSGVLGRELVERGKLSVKRPGRMLWEYEEPEKKVFVSDGKTFYFYVPADRQVVVRDQAGDRRAPALLLSGEGNILDQFEVSLEAAPPGRQLLRLLPREPDPEIEVVLVEVDGRLRFRRIEVVDAQGNLSRFTFEKIEEDVGLSDRIFHFEIPPGVDVITG